MRGADGAADAVMTGDNTIPLAATGDLIRARARVRALAQAAGLDAADQARLATAVSELGRNAIDFAGGGACHLSDASDAGEIRIRVEVVDRGPGVADVALAMRDGYSSAGRPGFGLAGVKRLLDGFDFATSPAGTRVSVQVRRKRHATPQPGARPARDGRARRATAGELRVFIRRYRAIFERFLFARDPLARERALYEAGEIGGAMLQAGLAEDAVLNLHSHAQRRAMLRLDPRGPLDERLACHRLAGGDARHMSAELLSAHEFRRRADRALRWQASQLKCRENRGALDAGMARADERMRAAEKRSAIATRAAGVAHDFNNLLGAVIGLTELCQDDAEPGSRLSGNLGKILSAAQQANALTRSMPDF